MSSTAQHLDWFISSSKSTLHVDSSAVNKEIRAIPACDGLTVSYCKEWTQLIYKQFYANLGSSKKRMAKNAGKNQQQSSQSMADDEDLLGSDQERLLAEQSRSAEFICSRLQKQLDMGNPFDLDSSPQQGNQLIIDLRKSLSDWIQAKPLSILIEERLQPFKVFDVEKIGDLEIDKDLLQLLKNVQPDKNGFTLSKSPLPRIRGAFSDEVLEPKMTGCHDKNDLLPSQLESKINSINDDVKKLQSDITGALGVECTNLWQPILALMDFLSDQLHTFRKEVGADNVDHIVLGRLNSKWHMDTVLPFEKLWEAFHDDLKRKLQSKAIKNEDVQHVDDVINKYIEFYEHFLEEESFKAMCDGIVKQVRDYVEKYSLCLTEKISNLENNFSDTDIETVKQEAIKSLSNACSRILENRIMLSQRELSEEREQFSQDLSEFRSCLFGQTDSPTISGRIERLQKKDIRKGFKKLEHRLAAFITLTRSHLSTLFPTFYLVYLGYLVINFTIYVTNRTENRVFANILGAYAHQISEITVAKAEAQDRWRFGMEDGAMSLATVFAKLFVQECGRVHLEWELEKKEESLLKAIGEKPTAEEKPAVQNAQDTQSASLNSKKKKKKNKKKNGTEVVVDGCDTPEMSIETGSDIVVDKVEELSIQDSAACVENGFVVANDAQEHTSPPPGIAKESPTEIEKSPRALEYDQSLEQVEKMKAANESLRQNYVDSIQHIENLQKTVDDLGRKNAELVQVLQGKDLQLANATIRIQFLEMRLRELEPLPGNFGIPATPISSSPLKKDRLTGGPGFPAPIGFERPSSSSSNYTEEMTRSPNVRIPQEQNNSESNAATALFGHRSLDAFNVSPLANIFPSINGLGLQRTVGSRGWPDQLSTRPFGSSVRCSNCGMAGHASQQCREGCRYCGSSKHLSELCDKPLM